jgi:tRNA 5-methylaminomethyl-2-thiouridine biosynthesis bifunctional protein
MKPRPAALEPADIEFDADGVPRSRTYGDLYHPRDGAREQARHVFLAGNGLPERWQGREDFTILETGFGLGHNFLAAWEAWRDDPRRCRRLHVVSIEAHPARRDDLARAHAAPHASQPAAALIDAWPAPEPGLHLLEFEEGAVRLWLALGDVAHWLPRLRVRADAFFLDGFAPACNPQMWTPRVLDGLSRLAAARATAATWSAARPVREGLERAGFAVHVAPGFGRKRDMTTASFAPRRGVATPPRGVPAWPPAAEPPALPAPAAASAGAPEPGRQRHALVIGAGLAGAAAAAALARAGWRCTVLERHPEAASEASGNPAGIFHAGAGHGEHRHAELLAWAARLAAPRYRALAHAGLVRGAASGLEHDQQPDASGGWVAPRDLVTHWLSTPGVTLLARHGVERLHRDAQGWQAWGPGTRPLACGDIAVLAGGAGLTTLLEAAGGEVPEARLVRGQLSWVDWPDVLQRPVTGQGYALTLPGGPLVFGATAHAGDFEPALRPADHAWNVERLRALTGIALPPGGAWAGRVAWRCTGVDRLPWVGAVPLRWPDDALPRLPRLDRPVLVPRERGLYVIGGFGSRGLTWAPLMAELLAAWVDGTPMPLPGELVDALDPAREVLRRARQAASRAHRAARSG